MGNNIHGERSTKSTRNRLASLNSVPDVEVVSSIVFLGTGNTGKTTLFTHFQFLLAEREHELDFIKQSRATKIVYSLLNQLGKLLTLLVKRESEGGSDFSSVMEIVNKLARWHEIEGDTYLDINRMISEFQKKEYRDDLARLWNMEEIQSLLWECRSIHCIPETLDYFIRERERICRANYIPTKEDTLKLDTMTLGVTEARVNYNERAIVLVDTGGQKSERRKWRLALRGARILIFTVSLSDFDQNLYEDPSVSRSIDSLEAFANFLKKLETSGEMLVNMRIFLVFTKRDLVREKFITLRQTGESLSEYIPGLECNVSIEKALAAFEDNISKQYLALIPEELQESFMPFHYLSTLAENEVAACLNTILQEAIMEL